MDDLLRGYGQALFEEALDSGALAAQLAALEALSAALVRSDQLRQVLTDSNVPVSARRAVIEDLLSAGAPAEAVQLVAFAIGAVRATELPNALVDLEALAASLSTAGPTGESEASVGRSATRDRQRGYTERVLQELDSPSQIDEVEDDLFRLARIIDSSPALRRVLADANLAPQGRADVLTDLLSGKASATTARIASYAVRAGSTRDVVGTFDWLVELCAAERGRRVGEVRSAIELSDEERDRLGRALSSLVGRNVEVRVVIDKDVIGGALISVGDLVIDGSVRLRLERLRDALTQ